MRFEELLDKTTESLVDLIKYEFDNRSPKPAWKIEVGLPSNTKNSGREKSTDDNWLKNFVSSPKSDVFFVNCCSFERKFEERKTDHRKVKREEGGKVFYDLIRKPEPYILKYLFWGPNTLELNTQKLKSLLTEIFFDNRKLFIEEDVVNIVEPKSQRDEVAEALLSQMGLSNSPFYYLNLEVNVESSAVIQSDQIVKSRNIKINQENRKGGL